MRYLFEKELEQRIFEYPQLAQIITNKVAGAGGLTERFIRLATSSDSPNQEGALLAMYYSMKVAQATESQLDQTYGKKRFPHPDGGDVSYWTLKKWVTDKKVDSRKKDHAKKLFDQMREEAGGGEGGGSGKSVALPKEIFSDRFHIKGANVTSDQMREVGEQLKKTFATPGYKRGAVGQLVATMGTDEAKRLFHATQVAVRGVQIAWSKSKEGKACRKKNSEKEAIKACKESANKAIDESMQRDPEVKANARSLGMAYFQSTALPYLAPVLGVSAGSTASSFLGTSAMAKGIVAATGLSGAAAFVAPTIIGLGIGSVVFKKVFHSGLSLGKRTGKKDERAKFDSLASDIYAGYQTPESVEAEYNAKVDDILNYPHLDFSGMSDEEKKKAIADFEKLSSEEKDRIFSANAGRMKERMEDLYNDFQDNARPAIDRALYNIEGFKLKNVTDVEEKEEKQSKKAEDAESQDSGAAPNIPALLRMRTVLDGLRLQEEVETLLTEEDISSELTEVFQGGDIDPEVVKLLKKSLAEGEG